MISLSDRNVQFFGGKFYKCVDEHNERLSVDIVGDRWSSSSLISIIIHHQNRDACHHDEDCEASQCEGGSVLIRTTPG